MGLSTKETMAFHKTAIIAHVGGGSVKYGNG